MDKSVLLQYFDSLSNKEIRDLGHFVRSPYFNRREKVVKLFDYLVEYRHLPEGAISKEKAWKFIFGQQAYDDREMRYTMSFLLKVIRQFLIQNELEKDTAQAQVVLCRALQRHKLGKLLEKELRHSIEEQQKQALRHSLYHLHNYQLEMVRVEHITQQTRTGDIPLQALFDELNFFYIAEMLRQSSIILTHQTVSKRDYNLRLQDSVIEHLEQHDYTQVPAIAIYYHSYKALSDSTVESHFVQLKALIEEHWSSFPAKESRDFYLLAINYCIQKLNQGERSYIREAFELYKSGLENGLFLENGILSSFTYTNVSRLGLALEEWEWVQEFLKRYHPTLKANDRDNIYRYNMAFFYFQQSEYDHAMEYLIQLDHLNDVFQNLDARRMMLRIYYEQGAVSPLLSLLDSFKVYISRHKDIGYHKTNYLNLIRFVRQMLNSNLSSGKVREALISKVEQTSSVAEKTWLISQLKKRSTG